MNRPFFYSLPPAGQRIPFKDLISNIIVNRGSRFDDANETIRKYLGSDHGVLYLSSGRAALWLYLKTISAHRPERKEVIVPAYSCPSVVSAVLKAGLIPVLCDNNLEDFGYLTHELENRLSRKTLAVIVAHLYGVPADISKTQGLCGRRGVFLVEDAAQAFGNTYPGRPDEKLGLAGDAGFFSFGRGKPLSILHGGILTIKSKDVFSSAFDIFTRMKGCSPYHNVRYALSLGMYSLFFTPYLYWLPQLIPFLNLGGTVFEPEFKMKKGSGMAAALADVMIRSLDKEKVIRTNNAQWYANNIVESFIRNVNGIGEYPYLRYPVMIDDKNLRNRILRKLMAEGTGATGSYPTPLNELPRLREVLVDETKYRCAKRISESIITLPVHSGVDRADRDKIKKIIRQESHAN